MRPDPNRDGPRAMPRGDRRPTSSPTSAEVVSTIARPTGRGLADATGRLGDQLGVLGVALAQWAARDDSRAHAAIRRAASTAIETADAMLAELHGLRADLIGQIRRSDDLAAERVDELLGRAPRKEEP
jgi:hypothetical protein